MFVFKIGVPVAIIRDKELASKYASLIQGELKEEAFGESFLRFKHKKTGSSFISPTHLGKFKEMLDKE